MAETNSPKVEEKVEAKIAETPKAKPNYLLYGLAAAVVILAAGDGFFIWQYFKKTDANKLQTTQLNNLADDLATAKKDISRLQKTANVTPAPSPVPTVAASLAENISAAINTMNTAALEGYMASSVNVVYAATEFGGPRTPAQAVGDLNYLNSATAPWDFDLPQTVLDDFAAGGYATYFGANKVVGESANDYVVSFSINNAGKIDGIFIAASSELLI